MSLSGIVYLSEATVDFNQEDTLKLVQDARKNNEILGVTGYLCQFRGRFIQYIEAPATTLNDLYSRIQADERHKILYHAEAAKFTHRRFPRWGMRMITDADLKRYNVELVLENNLLYLKNDFPNPEAITNNIWMLVDTISRIHGK